MYPHILAKKRLPDLPERRNFDPQHLYPSSRIHSNRKSSRNTLDDITVQVYTADPPCKLITNGFTQVKPNWSR